jgi:hypothetical protein
MINRGSGKLIINIKMIILGVLLMICLSAESVSVKLIPETGSPPSARQISGLTYDLDSRKQYIYGGRLANRFGELWSFDLLTQKWSEIHPSSTQTAISNTYQDRVKYCFLEVIL